VVRTGQDTLVRLRIGDGPSAEAAHVRAARDPAGDLRAFCNEGNRMLMSRAMIAMTTSSSIRVKPLAARRRPVTGRWNMTDPPKTKGDKPGMLPDPDDFHKPPPARVPGTRNAATQPSCNRHATPPAPPAGRKPGSRPSAGARLHEMNRPLVEMNQTRERRGLSPPFFPPLGSPPPSLSFSPFDLSRLAPSPPAPGSPGPC